MIQRQPAKFIKDAIFLSHTSLNDFLNCPRAYYLKNVYRDPQNDYKLQIASPYLTLGATVHDCLKWFLENGSQGSLLNIEDQFRSLWRKYRGKRGGFNSIEEEAAFGNRGLKMLENFLANVKKLNNFLPFASFPKYPLLENVILHGNMDYAGELPDGTLHLIDFKTGAKDEESPLQLYIYAILAENYYEKPVSKISFWYLDRDDGPKEVVLEPLEKTIEWLTIKGQEVRDAIAQDDWVCTKGEELCRDCQNYLAILEGKGEFLFSDHAFKKEVYFLRQEKPDLLIEDNSSKQSSVAPS